MTPLESISYPAFVGLVVILCGLCIGLGNCYCGVVKDYQTVKDNPMYQLMSDIDAFMGNVTRNVCGQKLLEQFQWLKSMKVAIDNNCSILPQNLKNLMLTGYVFALYNTLLMHVLLSGSWPVSGVTCIPIVTSIATNHIDPSHIALLELFELAQSIISLVIMFTFAVRERQRSDALAATHSEK